MAPAFHHPRDPHERPPAVGSPAEALRRLVGRGSVYTVLLAIQLLAGMLVLPVITRLLSPASYGKVAAGLVVLSMLTIIGSAGLPDAAARTFFARDEGPRDARRLIAAMACIAIGMAVVIDASGPLWAPLFGLKYGGVLRLAVWGGAAGAVMAGAQSMLRVAERVWAYTAVALLGAIGGQAVGLALTAWLGSPTAYMAGITAGAILAAALGLAISGALRDGIARRAELGGGLGLGLPIVPHSLAVYMLASADRIVIAAVLGLAATGRYQVAYAVGGLGVALVTAINQAWVPLLLGAQPERRWEILTATSRVVYLVAAFVASVLALSAPLLLLVAASASYGRRALVPVAAVVAFSALPYAAAGTYFQVVLVSARTRVMAVAAPLAAIVNIAINIALLPVVGLIGASLATVAAYAVLPVVVSLRARRIVPLPGAFRASVRAWLLAAPFVAAGAFLPVDALGVTLRVGAGIAVTGVVYRLLRSATRTSSVPVDLRTPETVLSDDDTELQTADGLASSIRVGRL